MEKIFYIIFKIWKKNHSWRLYHWKTKKFTFLGMSSSHPFTPKSCIFFRLRKKRKWFIKVGNIRIPHMNGLVMKNIFSPFDCHFFLLLMQYFFIRNVLTFNYGCGWRIVWIQKWGAGRYLFQSFLLNISPTNTSSRKDTSLIPCISTQGCEKEV